MVVAYHQVIPETSAYLYGVTRRMLLDHLTLYRSLGSAAPLVTFDDGHATQAEEAAPLLEQFGLRGTFFITAGWIGQPGYMTLEQLRSLAARGHRIGAHGWSHKMLTRCSPSELYDELRRARLWLEEALGQPVSTVSFPHGRWNRRVLEACRLAGYDEVYTSDPHIGATERQGLRVMGRLMVTQRSTPGQLAAFVRGGSSLVTGLRVRHVLKGALKLACGERLYHRLWCLAAADDQVPVVLNESGEPKRILQVISSGGYYGAESMLVNLSRSLNEAGCRTTIAVFRNSHCPHTEVADHALGQGLQTEVIDCRGKLDRGAVARIRALILRDGIDLIHTHGFKSNLYAALAARPLGIPLVATYHLDWPDRGLALFCYHALDRLTLRAFRKVIAVSVAIEDSLRRARFPRAKLARIANGIDLARFVSAAAPERAEAAARDGLVIGLVGRLTPQKGHRYLLAAAAQLQTEFPRARFVFYGEGPDRQALEQQTAALGLSEQVVFAGARADMPAVYASLDLLVLPSLNEGMPMTLIEALAARRPVIASAVGDVPELVRHGETGWLVPPADPGALASAMRTLLSDPALRERLAGAGQALVCQNFSAQFMAENYRRVYREAVAVTS